MATLLGLTEYTGEPGQTLLLMLVNPVSGEHYKISIQNLLSALQEDTLDHTLLQNIGTNTHAQLDSHLADATKHFLESAISHLNITDIGSNSHAQLDSHLADATKHFLESAISHLNITDIGSNSHADIDTHIGDDSLHKDLPFDNVLIEYVDQDDITVKAGGKFTDDAGALHEITSDITVNTASDLTSADTLTADTWYYLWGGLDSSDVLTFVLSDDGTTRPSELTTGRCLRAGISIWDDSGTLKIRPFDFDGQWYRYRSGVDLYTGTYPTTWTSLDLSPYVPDMQTVGLFNSYCSSWVIDNPLPVLYFSLDAGTISLNMGYGHRDGSFGDKRNNMSDTFFAPLQPTIHFYTTLAFPTSTLTLYSFEVR